ncbi:hypothetical protein BDZ45DRAFT_695613 [Acephala macrosclerotiorum]|nr:hypothetical protein BDZ45DRAFT_695613 [Acephala macrosclerotiorum]
MSSTVNVEISDEIYTILEETTTMIQSQTSKSGTANAGVSDEANAIPDEIKIKIEQIHQVIPLRQYKINIGRRISLWAVQGHDLSIKVLSGSRLARNMETSEVLDQATNETFTEFSEECPSGQYRVNDLSIKVLFGLRLAQMWGTYIKVSGRTCQTEVL